MQLHVGGKHHCESEKEDQKWKKMTWAFFKQLTNFLQIIQASPSRNRSYQNIFLKQPY